VTTEWLREQVKRKEDESLVKGVKANAVRTFSARQLRNGERAKIITSEVLRKKSRHRY